MPEEAVLKELVLTELVLTELVLTDVVVTDVVLEEAVLFIFVKKGYILSKIGSMEGSTFSISPRSICKYSRYACLFFLCAA